MDAAQDPLDGVVVGVDHLTVLLDDGVQEGSHDMVLVLCEVEGPLEEAAGEDIQQLNGQIIAFRFNGHRCTILVPLEKAKICLRTNRNTKLMV